MTVARERPVWEPAEAVSLVLAGRDWLSAAQNGWPRRAADRLAAVAAMAADWRPAAYPAQERAVLEEDWVDLLPKDSYLLAHLLDCLSTIFQITARALTP